MKNAPLRGSIFVVGLGLSGSQTAHSIIGLVEISYDLFLSIS